MTTFHVDVPLRLPVSLTLIAQPAPLGLTANAFVCGVDTPHGVAGSRPALDRLAVADGPERWLESLAALRPDLDLEPSGALLSTWSDDPWARGAYSVHTPGGNDSVLGAPCGALIVAGEYTAGPFAGLMEGALRSGIRAAIEFGARPSSSGQAR